ncbi:hypothetical protein TUN199_04089 [Pyrenophora tritici-repentis]|uniref:Uncharacterized protein n=1 Tax=Pyrenophora tritici-repentis TaxID=45151 RepID=A0A317A425_9PLEO|nr:hypothetical protein PtrV1_08606 [Pyrenophora tritici-repentis]KAF7449650.1 hypothetical protein A1F99_066990 [Pyrenophora tritici-repentis]KAF7570229.1 hypothetical protein PtrM4_102310 [Pyrenophora tritici-repentis]KAI0577549.1 hypothetical protein Alg215_06854 [Pyrenophora tritici-repentis]KAI0586852.1 hypothetical protein Alg130_04059 [Pyrenophora tritici-repentis]
MKFLIVCAALLGLAAAVPNAHFKNAVRDSDACNGVQCEGTTPSTGTHPPSRPPTKARSDEAAMEKRETCDFGCVGSTESPPTGHIPRPPTRHG